MGRHVKPYPPELRERAVLMVAEVRPSYRSQWAAIVAVQEKLGIGTAETLRGWVRQAEVDAGSRAGVTTEAAEEVARLKREVAELRRANEMADSSGGRKELCELLRWCQIAQRLARPAVEAVLDRVELFAADVAQVGALGQVLAQ